MKVICVTVEKEFYYARYDGKHNEDAEEVLKTYIEEKLVSLKKADEGIKALRGIMQVGGPVIDAAFEAAWTKRQEILDTFISQTTDIVVVDVFVDYDSQGGSISTVRHDRCRVKVK